MRWFVLRYIFQIVSGDNSYAPQFDEQLRLIQAGDANEALLKGESQASGFHKPFRNCNGELVKWEFICIADLYEIDAPQDGVEISSVVHEPANLANFMDELRRREAFVQQHVLIETSN